MTKKTTDGGDKREEAIMTWQGPGSHLFNTIEVFCDPGPFRSSVRSVVDGQRQSIAKHRRHLRKGHAVLGNVRAAAINRRHSSSGATSAASVIRPSNGKTGSRNSVNCAVILF